MSDATSRTARRRLVAAVCTVGTPLALVVWGGHRGLHAARGLLVPGAGLVEERPVVAAALALAAVAATVAWLRWGMDWLVVTVLVIAAAVTFAVTPAGHGPSVGAAGRAAGLALRRGAHEFPLVLLVASAAAWARAATRRLPGAQRWAERRARRRERHGLDDVARLGAPERSRCAALVLLAGDAAARAGAPQAAAGTGRAGATADAVGDAAVGAVIAAGTGDAALRRARRVDRWARFRRTSGAPAVDHAHLRAALALVADHADAPAVAALAADAARRDAGVPASEPGWVRPLDATLAALALARCGRPEAGRRWAAALAGPFALRRGHRPAWLWTPFGLAAGRAPAWEHAAVAGLARAAGWTGDADWAALRTRALAAAARGTAVPDDERLIAAGRLWLPFVDDELASRVLARPTVRFDPLAVALDAVASRLRHDPGAFGPRDTVAGMQSDEARTRWETRYGDATYVFGTEPNDFLRDHAGALPPGRVLCLAEGEGRNAVFLAGLGFAVSSIDLADAGVAKTRRLAAERGVTVDAVQGDLADADLGDGTWQAIVSVFAHTPPAVRRAVHRRVVRALAPGGVFLLEAYTPAQIGRGTGGPATPEFTPTLAELLVELDGLEVVHGVECECPVVEGPGHTGVGAVVQLIARRPA